MDDDEREGAQITHHGLLSVQVCVPHDWTDARAVAFAEKKSPCGTMSGWSMRQDGDDRLRGDPARCPCASRPGFVHIMMDA